MSEERHVYTVKAFTADPQGGNPAGVVAEAAGLRDDHMQAVAAVMGFPETAFVLPSDVPGAEFRLRWFTPTVEVPLCGHATIATLKVLADAGRFPTDGSPRMIETHSGVLRVVVERGDGRRVHRLQIPLPEFTNLTVPEELAKNVFRLYPSDRMSIWPSVNCAFSPLVPVISIGTLRKLRPDFARMTREWPYPGVCFFTGETLQLGNTWHCRFFAPGYGILEDPVTGAMNGPLGAYRYRFVDPVKPPRAEYIGEQGDVIGSPGRVLVRVKGDGTKATDLEIGGEAVIIGRERLEDVLDRSRAS